MVTPATTTTIPAIFSLINYTPTRHVNTPPSFLTPKLNPRSRISHKAPVLPKVGCRGDFHSCCCIRGSSGINSEIADGSSEAWGRLLSIRQCDNPLPHFGWEPSWHWESSINIKLPRRSMLVQFTCNSCGVRTKRMINRAAYERGTVYVQCSGCEQYHQLVDNLGLVVEYNLWEDAPWEDTTED